MKRFNSSTVRALGNLQSTSEKQKAHIRRTNGIKVRFAMDRPAAAFKATRDFLAPVRPDYVPAKPRGRSGCRMSPEKRAMVLARHDAREAFFASLSSDPAE